MQTKNLPDYDWTLARPGDIFTADLIQTNGHKARPMLINAVIPDRENTDNYHLICTPITSKGIDKKSVYKRYNINASDDVNNYLNYELQTNYSTCFRASEMVFLSGAEIKNSRQQLKFVGNLNEIKHNELAIQKANELIDKKHAEIGTAYHNYQYQKQHNTDLYCDKMKLAFNIENGNLLSEKELAHLTTAQIIDANVKPVQPEKYHLYQEIPNEPEEKNQSTKLLQVNI